jgi:hypothetical protein
MLRSLLFGHWQVGVVGGQRVDFAARELLGEGAHALGRVVGALAAPFRSRVKASACAASYMSLRMSMRSRM